MSAFSSLSEFWQTMLPFIMLLEIVLEIGLFMYQLLRSNKPVRSLLSLAVMAVMIPLLFSVSQADPDNIGDAFLLGAPWLIFAAAIFLAAVHFAIALPREYRRKKNELSPFSIKEATDKLPMGICFADPNGRIILRNNRMRRLSFALCGHELQIKSDMENALSVPDRSVTVKDDCYILPDKTVWQFRTQNITVDGDDRWQQITAHNVTELYNGCQKHEALESFAEEVRKRGMKWTELTEQERNEIADRCLDNIVADYGNTVLKSSARNEYMIERTRRILRRTVWALQKQLEQGEFQPEGFEVTFGGGRIDRVDIMEDQNKVYVKVIDYKTGNTSFDLVYLYHGLQLQLMIYLDGALRVEQKKYPDKEIIPAGVFYYNIKDPMIQEKIDADVEAVSAGLMKELKMNGLVQADPELVYRMDSSLGSIPVAFNKDGNFRKNSSVADRTQFAVLGRYVRTKIEKIRSSILEGDAEVSPYELGKKNACTYCPYMTVCGFDRRLSGYEFRRLKNFSDEELWKAFDREAE